MNADLSRVAGGPVRKGTRLRIEFFTDQPEVVEGKVVSADEGFLVLSQPGHAGHPVEQEYVLYSGFYGAHGDLDGIVDLAAAGKAEVTILGR